MSDQDSFQRMNIALLSVLRRVQRHGGMDRDDMAQFWNYTQCLSILLSRYDPNTTAIVDETSEEFGAVIDRHHESSTE